ncbi:MAG: copper amine oxidase N-terminal domain-containing protein [Lachnospirales bacterium]
MKKYLALLISMLILSVNCYGGYDYNLIVEENKLNMDNLPSKVYSINGTYFVPLRIVAEQLGYNVEWNSNNKTICVEDSIQSAVLSVGSKTVDYNGKLKIIDLTQTIKLNEAVVNYDGYVYVPVEFFEPFFNDIEIKNGDINITVQKAEIQ